MRKATCLIEVMGVSGGESEGRVGGCQLGEKAGLGAVSETSGISLGVLKEEEGGARGHSCRLRFRGRETKRSVLSLEQR